MRILFIRPNTVLPELFAGTELTLHGLCRSLIAKGHHVFVAATTFAEDAPPALDYECGYPVVRAWNGYEATCFVLERFQPDVLVVSQAGAWLDLLPSSIRHTPLVVYEQEVSRAVTVVPADIKARAVFLANSAATARHLARICGVDATIVKPLFGIEDYVGVKRSGDAVLFVSLQRRKGADVAVKIARARPQVPFIFVESWSEDRNQSAQLRDEVWRLANVALLPNQRGLLHIMPKIKLHLMPSRSQEAWGRTATEAQICGIPVLASSRGNLPVTVGPGGITLDPDEPIEAWLQKFDAIMNDTALYQALSAKATEHGRAAVTEAKRAYQTFERSLDEATTKARA